MGRREFSNHNFSIRPVELNDKILTKTINFTPRMDREEQKKRNKERALKIRRELVERRLEELNRRLEAGDLSALFESPFDLKNPTLENAKDQVVKNTPTISQGYSDEERQRLREAGLLWTEEDIEHAKNVRDMYLYNNALGVKGGAPSDAAIQRFGPSVVLSYASSAGLNNNIVSEFLPVGGASTVAAGSKLIGKASMSAIRAFLKNPSKYLKKSGKFLGNFMTGFAVPEMTKLSYETVPYTLGWITYDKATEGKDTSLLLDLTIPLMLGLGYSKAGKLLRPYVSNNFTTRLFNSKWMRYPIIGASAGYNLYNSPISLLGSEGLYALALSKDSKENDLFENDLYLMQLHKDGIIGEDVDPTDVPMLLKLKYPGKVDRNLFDAAMKWATDDLYLDYSTEEFNQLLDNAYNYYYGN